MNRLKCQGLVQHVRGGKEYDGCGLLLHKRKDGDTQSIYRYTLHRRRSKMSLGVLRDVLLKQALEFATGWRSILREGRDPIVDTQ